MIDHAARIKFLVAHAHLPLTQVGALMAPDAPPRSKQWVQYLYRRYKIDRPAPTHKPPGTHLGLTKERLQYLITHQPPGSRAALLKALARACSCCPSTIRAALKAHQLLPARVSPLAARNLKYCWRCKQIQPKSQFYKHRSRPDGLQPICKSCIRALNEAKSSWHKRCEQNVGKFTKIPVASK